MGGVGKAIGSVVGGLTGGFMSGAPGVQQAQSPISNAQFQDAYKQSLDQAAQQRAFLQAIQGQNGLQNQTDIYNQFGQIAQGQGPNPAQAMLANSTGANIANQAALMASQRGSSANPALMARQAAQQGAGIQQNAIGQGAAMQAQQSMNALGAQGNMANTMVNNQAQQQQGAFNNAQQLAGMGQNALQNTANMNNQQALAQQQQYGNIMGGLMQGAGTALAGAFKAAEGGAVPGPKSFVVNHMLAKGGQVPALVSPGEKYLSPAAVSKVKHGADPMSVGEKIPGKPNVSGATNSYANDTVKKTLQEGGIVIPRSVTQSKDPHSEATKFINAVFAKQGKLPKKAK